MHDFNFPSLQVRITLQLGTAREKTLYVGQSLNDDIYHSVVIRRRGRNVRATVDDDEPLLGKLRDSRNSPIPSSQIKF